MRSMLAIVFGGFALLAGLATMPAAWVAHNVASEDGYVSFTEPLARDKAFHQAIADAVAENLTAKAGLPPALQAPTTAAISTATIRIAGTPGFVKAWDDTQRQSHQIMLGDQRNLPAKLDYSDRLAVDLGPMSAFVVAKVNKGLPVKLTAPRQLIVSVGGNSSRDALEQIRKTPDWERGGIIATAVLVALCLLAARRRALAVAALGVGAIVLAAALHGLSSAALPELIDRNTSTSNFGTSMAQVLADRAADSFDQWLIALAIGGAMAAAVGLVVNFGFSSRAKA